jgi:integration host factor beta subunit
MTKRDLIDEIVRIYPAYSRRDAEVIVNAVFESMTEALCTGERIEIRGFGSFVVKQRRAREGRNPKTGDLVAVAAKRVPFFKVGKELKQRVDDTYAGDRQGLQGEGDASVSDSAGANAVRPRPALSGGSSSV